MHTSTPKTLPRRHSTVPRFFFKDLQENAAQAIVKLQHDDKIFQKRRVLEQQLSQIQINLARIDPEAQHDPLLDKTDKHDKGIDSTKLRQRLEDSLRKLTRELMALQLHVGVENFQLATIINDYKSALASNPLYQSIHAVTDKLKVHTDTIAKVHGQLITAKHLLRSEVDTSSDLQEVGVLIESSLQGFSVVDWISGKNGCIAILQDKETKESFTLKLVPIDVEQAIHNNSSLHAYYWCQGNAQAKKILPTLYDFIEVKSEDLDPEFGYIYFLEFSEYFPNGDLESFFKTLHAPSVDDASAGRGKIDDEAYEDIIIYTFMFFKEITVCLLAQVRLGVYYPDIKLGNLLLDVEWQIKITDLKEYLKSRIESALLDGELSDRQFQLLTKVSEIGLTGQYSDKRILSGKDEHSIHMGPLIFQNILLAIYQALTNHVYKSADNPKNIEVTHPIFHTPLAQELNLQEQLQLLDLKLNKIDETTSDIDFLSEMHQACQAIVGKIPEHKKVACMKKLSGKSSLDSPTTHSHAHMFHHSAAATEEVAAVKTDAVDYYPKA